jgi:hypothetical protein
MEPYMVRQVDEEGEVLSENEVMAPSYSAVLRQISETSSRVQRIEVYNQEGDRAGAVDVDYWRRTVRRGR